MFKKLLFITLVGLLLVSFMYWEKNGINGETDAFLISSDELNEIPPQPAIDLYGFREGAFEIVTDRVKRNESLYIILRRHGVSPQQIYLIEGEVSEHANLRRLRTGQRYKIYKGVEGDTKAMIWLINSLEYLVMDWSEGFEQMKVRRDAHELTEKQASASGVINSSLYETLQDEGVTQMLGSKLADIFAWEIDFFALRRGDNFRVLYDEVYAADEFYGIGKIRAAEFEHRGEAYRAYYFDHPKRSGYFDKNGNSLQKELLKAPFNYSQRITSGFSHNRYHPILKQRRPHYGVDYAAPPGTPVLAVGDGEIIEAQHRGGNGNIVRIRHNSVYRTAYLHLRGFAPGIRPGAKVEQGQAIGYVGQTGLATGPHLCYRMYVNNSPVNPLTVDLPASESLEEEYMEEFTNYRKALDEQLDYLFDNNRIAEFNTSAFDGERN